MVLYGYAKKIEYHYQLILIRIPMGEMVDKNYLLDQFLRGGEWG
jgi:hypothetical protein